LSVNDELRWSLHKKYQVSCEDKVQHLSQFNCK
jgi:hypothetical protein